MTSVESAEHFPIFTGETAQIDKWNEQETISVDIRQTLSRGEPYIYSPLIPWIVGHVPQTEREYFDTLPDAKPAGQNYQVWHGVWPDGLSQTRQTVQRDGQLLRPSETDFSPAITILERKTISPGKAPRQNRRDYHLDGDFESPTWCYLITNGAGTEFYTGDVEVTPRNSQVGVRVGNGVIPVESIDHSIPTITAPPYAILRMSSLCLHRSPLIDQETTRTFLAASGPRNPVLEDRTWFQRVGIGGLFSVKR